MGREDRDGELESLQVRAESYGCAPGLLECRARRFERRTRIVRSARTAGLLSLAGVLSIPFPVWHVLAVPGFLIGAVYLGRARLRQELAIAEVSGACPACGEKQSFAVPPAARFPHTTSCPACRAFLKLVDVR